MFTVSARRVFSGDKGGPWFQCALPFLTVASWGYEAAVRVRLEAFRLGLLRQRRLPIPVISVGNLSVGGSGKTPLVIALAELLSSQGIRVGVLSRGYRGAEPRTPLVVSDGRTMLCADPAIAGDEPVLIARRVPGSPVVVCTSRWKGGLLAATDLGCQVLLLDDGFQHLSLFRELDVLVFRCGNPWGNGRLLPRGPLREPLSALRRAELAVAVSESPETPIPPEIASLGLPVLAARLSVAGTDCFWPLSAPVKLPPLRGTRVLCLSGVAAPQSFENLARQEGAEVADHLAFGDHHRYTSEDLVGAWARARAVKAGLVLTTGKDGVKIGYILRRERTLDLSPIPGAELRVTLDLPTEELLREVRKRVRLPKGSGGGRL